MFRHQVQNKSAGVLVEQDKVVSKCIMNGFLDFSQPLTSRFQQKVNKTQEMIHLVKICFSTTELSFNWCSLVFCSSSVPKHVTFRTSGSVMMT